jgi:hypothetical protein
MPKKILCDKQKHCKKECPFPQTKIPPALYGAVFPISCFFCRTIGLFPTRHIQKRAANEIDRIVEERIRAVRSSKMVNDIHEPVKGNGAVMVQQQIRQQQIVLLCLEVIAGQRSFLTKKLKEVRLIRIAGFQLLHIGSHNGHVMVKSFHDAQAFFRHSRSLMKDIAALRI